MNFALTSITVSPGNVERFKGEFMMHGSRLTKYKSKRLYELFPASVFSTLAADEVSIVQTAHPYVPHFDVGSVTKLNVYLETAGGITRFWKKAHPDVPAQFNYDGVKFMPEELQVPNQFSEDDLIFIDEFSANAGEAYLLDVSQIHSLELTELNSVRSHVQFMWFKKPFAEILNRLALAGLVQTAR